MAKTPTPSNLLEHIEPINKLLEKRFGLRIQMESIEHLTQVRNHYSDKRKMLLQRLGEAEAIKHPDYTKAVLISEGISMLLREIAPKRKKRK